MTFHKVKTGSWEMSLDPALHSRPPPLPENLRYDKLLCRWESYYNQNFEVRAKHFHHTKKKNIVSIFFSSIGKWQNQIDLQSSRPWRLAMDSPSVLARMNGAPPGADRSPAVSGERLSDWMAMSSSLFRVTCGTQHVISHEGPGQPPSLIPPFIQHMTVSVQLSHCPSLCHAHSTSAIENNIINQ